MRTVADLFEAWPAAAPGLGDRSAETIARTLQMAAPFEHTFGRRRLEGLEPVEVAAWAARFPARARYARVILADAVVLRAVPASPFVGVRVKRPKGRGEYVPTWEEVLALAAAGERYGLEVFTLVAACSGARLSALADLRARDVRCGRLTLARKGKDGAYPAIVLEPGREMLEEIVPRLAHPISRVFRKPGGKPWDRKSVSRVWVKMRGEVGLPASCTFHSTRKAFATRLLDEGKSMMDVAFALDHVDAQGRPNVELVQKIYGRPSRDEALARLVA